ncbi:MAG: CheR family methyltransferase [Cyclobacteriaceae bacterium]
METNFSFTVHEKQKLKPSQFSRISQFVTANYGIRLPEEKKVMVEGRLQKRLRATGCVNFENYLELVFGEQDNGELIRMIDAISTNKTDFYRESAHFDFLANHVLPQFRHKSNKRNLSVWSAAASTGEEIYTLAMVLEEFNMRAESNIQIDYRILGTDISVEALKNAVNAVYKYERIRDVPFDIRNKYFLKSKNKESNTVRVIPRLRNKTAFKRLNLMDETYDIGQSFDMIFCRNVLIYFNKETQEAVINKLCQKLAKGGYFFLGHSESIIGKNVPLKPILPTIYERI